MSLAVTNGRENVEKVKLDKLVKWLVIAGSIVVKPLLLHPKDQILSSASAGGNRREKMAKSPV